MSGHKGHMGFKLESKEKTQWKSKGYVRTRHSNQELKTVE